MRRLFLLVAAVVLVDTMFYAAIAPLLPHYVDELGLSKRAAGLLTASYAAGTLVGSIPGGWLAARAGVKSTLMAGLGLLGVTSGGFGLGHHIVLLDSARFVQGVGGACTWAAGLAWLVSSAPRERRGELIGSALGAAIVGVLLGPALGGLATVAGPEPVFGGVAVAAAALLAWTASMPAGAPERPPRIAELWEALRRRPVAAAFWLFALPALFAGVLEVLVPLRMNALGATGVAVGAAFFAAAGVEATLSPIVGRISDRRGRVVPLRAGLAGAIAASLLLPLPGRAILVAAFLVLATAALGSFWAPAMAMISDVSEHAGLDQGLAFALANLAWAGGHVVGGSGGAALAAATADAVPYGAIALLCAVTLAGVMRQARLAPAG